MRALAFLTTTVLLAASATAQDVAQSLELSREVIDQQKRVVVAGSLPLSDDQANAFWPLYDKLQEEIQKLDARSDRLTAAYTSDYASLNDAQARALLDESLSITEDRAKLMSQWAKRMGKVLPPRLLVRYFQLEHRFYTFVAADLARQIPLAP